MTMLKLALSINVCGALLGLGVHDVDESDLDTIISRHVAAALESGEATTATSVIELMSRIVSAYLAQQVAKID